MFINLTQSKEAEWVSGEKSYLRWSLKWKKKWVREAWKASTAMLVASYISNLLVSGLACNYREISEYNCAVSNNILSIYATLRKYMCKISRSYLELHWRKLNKRSYFWEEFQCNIKQANLRIYQDNITSKVKNIKSSVNKTKIKTTLPS